MAIQNSVIKGGAKQQVCLQGTKCRFPTVRTNPPRLEQRDFNLKTVHAGHTNDYHQREIFREKDDCG